MSVLTCPHCNEEIPERGGIVLEDETNMIWKHTKCGGLMRSSVEAEEDAKKFMEKIPSQFKGFTSEI